MTPRLLEVLVFCLAAARCHRCAASQKKTHCTVQDGRADCSRLQLSAVPDDLPRNITSLDMSRNRLMAIPRPSLSPYAGLLHLDVSYNSITKMDGGVCRTLPLLETLVMEHNELYLLQAEDMIPCRNLTGLNIASNRLKLKGEPFSVLQRLKFLDVSKNNLMSARLGLRPQLPSLQSLNLGLNTFTNLAKDDFSFLADSSLRFLNLSFAALKTLEPGCFEPIRGLRTLIMDGTRMGTSGVSKLCSALSATAIEVLSLHDTKLVTLTATTFSGLQNTSLTALDLSHNGMGKIEDGSFQWLPKLQTLLLQENNIKHLMSNMFQGLGSLKKLNLTAALVKSHTSIIPVIDDFSFRPLRNLESLILHKTAIREITKHTFTGLTSLKELDMSWCSCTSLKNINATLVSLAESPLTKLNLVGTSISYIGQGALSFWGNLTTLLLDFNFLKQILTGKEFEGLGRLQVMHLAYNHEMIDLSPTSFANTPDLRILTLVRSLTVNSLNVDPSPLKPLSNLIFLDLSNNNIANIRENVFEGLDKLKTLKLQHNNLARLWKDFNLGGPVLFLKGLQSLETLMMDSNGFDEIPLQALGGLSNLREVTFGSNLLNDLRDSIFDDLTSLEVLHLERNLITSVRPEVFRAPARKLVTLSMGRNPFDCTCESILWFVTWLNRTNATAVPHLTDQYTCNTPRAYFNHSIVEFDTLSCKDMTPFRALFILNSTVVVMLLAASLLVRFHGWRVQFYWNILVNRVLGFSDAKAEEGREFEYDVYIIHAEEDASWVESRMIPLENDGCKFCLEDRDSVPGTSQLESILANMRNSRKILFVITESLLEDPWCRRFKAHHALHHVIAASRDSIILVFLQDVHDFKLSQSLCLRRGMLRPRCLLDWPVQKERVPAFHQKLLIALGLTNRLQE